VTVQTFIMLQNIQTSKVRMISEGSCVTGVMMLCVTGIKLL